MITPDTDPWANKDANRAACYAVWHQRAREEWEATRNPEAANAIVRIWEIRDAHQKNTGWSAEPLGQGQWRFTYMNPKTRLAGGTPVTITSKEGRAENI